MLQVEWGLRGSGVGAVPVEALEVMAAAARAIEVPFGTVDRVLDVVQEATVAAPLALDDDGPVRVDQADEAGVQGVAVAGSVDHDVAGLRRLDLRVTVVLKDARDLVALDPVAAI